MSLSNQMISVRAGNKEFIVARYGAAPPMAGKLPETKEPMGRIVSGDSKLAQAYNGELPLQEMELFQSLYTIPERPKAADEPKREQPALYNEAGIRILNGLMTINAICHYYGKDGAFQKETVSVEYMSEGENFIIQEMTLAEFKSMEWLNKLPNTDMPVDNKEFRRFMKQHLNQLYNGFEGTKTKIYARGGWIKLPSGKYGYLDAEKNVVDMDYTIYAKTEGTLKCNKINFQTVGNFNNFVNLRHITKKNPAGTMLIVYLLESYFYSLFKMADVVPKCILAIIGESGSRKTSLAKLTQFGESCFSFWDTSAGLETGFPRHKDQILLIDDYCPNEDAIQKANMDKNLELVSRSFGDASRKNRNTDFQKDKTADEFEYESCGGCIVTGEYYSGVQSSIARAVRLEIDRDTVDNECLSYYQENKDQISTFLCSILSFYAPDVKGFCGKISLIVREERKKYEGKFSNARFAEYIGQFAAAAWLLTNYGMSMGFLNHGSAQELYGEIYADITSVIEENARRLKALNPIHMLCEALNGFVHECSSNECFMASNGEVIYCKPEKLLEIFNRFCDKTGTVGMRYSKTDIRKMLEGTGLITPYMEGDKKRYSKKIANSTGRYFVIDTKLLQQILEETE